MSRGTKKIGKRETKTKKQESGKHRSSAFRRHSSVSTFAPSPWIGSAREIGSTQASASWTLVTLSSAAVAHYRHCCHLLLASGTAGHCRRRRKRLPLSTDDVASIGLSRHHLSRRPPFSTPTFLIANRCRCRCRCRYCLRPLLLHSLSFATTNGWIQYL